MSLPRPPSATSDRTAWWGFGVLTVVLIASLVGFSLLPPAPAPATGTDQQAAGPAGTPSARPTPTPSPTPTPPKLTSPGDSPLYRLELNVVACPTFTPREGRVPAAELRGYLQSVVDCLSASNREALQRAGLPTIAPTLAEDAELGSSACTHGEEPEGWAALYCGANNVIYYHPDWQEKDGPYVGVIAHEYAHHLQWLTGVLALLNEEEIATRSQPNGKLKENELSRRTELQAQCIAGATLQGSWSPLRSDRGYQDFLASTSMMTPDGAATHGTGRANTRWITAGATSNGPTHYQACNTFIVPADQVE